MMDFTKIKKLTIGGVELKQLLVGGIQVWKSGYKNWVKYSTEADGVTIYNGGLGYKDGYRIRSGGAEATHSVSSCTGFIPVMGGDVVRLSGYDIKKISIGNSINVAKLENGIYTNSGQIASNSGYAYGVLSNSGQNWDDVVLEKPGVYSWIVPSGYDIAAIRVTGETNADGTKMIVTINEEIT